MLKWEPGGLHGQALSVALDSITLYLPHLLYEVLHTSQRHSCSNQPIVLGSMQFEPFTAILNPHEGLIGMWLDWEEVRIQLRQRQ